MQVDEIPAVVICFIMAMSGAAVFAQFSFHLNIRSREKPDGVKCSSPLDAATRF
ncbi:MAG: hypothetical protein HFH60_01985 [Lachnospiraceae bacterium]|nr:hypothetical protein [Lachnospiraceae bacterium]